MNSFPAKEGGSAAVQLRIVAHLSLMVVGYWVLHQGVMCIPLSIFLLVQLGLIPMDQAVDYFMDQGTDQLVPPGCRLAHTCYLVP